MFESISMNGLLNKAQYEALSAKDKAEYDKAVKQLIEEFRAQNPNGLTVSMPISKINTRGSRNDGRLSVVVSNDGGNPLGLRAFKYAYNMLDNMAQNVRCTDPDDLADLIGGCFDDSHLVVTFVPVLAGEEYKDKNGNTKVYTVSHVRTTDDNIELCEEALDNLNAITREVAIKGRLERRKNRRQVKATAQTAEATAETAEVEAPADVEV
jgi:hypothetical protein